jgi:hypothetical protein
VTGFDPEELLAISLQCVDREFPHYLAHAVDGPIDFGRPADLHPAFFGCSDWHSAVHNHWLLLRLRREWPDLAGTEPARRVLDAHLNSEALDRELAYFHNPHNADFSRPYGWGWLLRVHAEALGTPDEDGQRWAAALRPLRDSLAAWLGDYFARRLQFPVRGGLHGNSAFSLLAGIDTARSVRDDRLAEALTEASRRMFLADRDYPTDFEPDGGDFLSPALTEAALLATVLEPAEFAGWLDGFLPRLAGDGASDPVLVPPVYVRDASDPATVHLNGLLLTKVWALCRIVSGLPSDDERAAPLAAAARAHFATAQDALADRHFHATHWIPTFALMAQSALSDAGTGESALTRPH